MGCHAFRVVFAVSNGRSVTIIRVPPFLTCCFSVCRIRQYPLFLKKEPPAVLAKHFEPGVFEKSQNYGRDKARFAFFSGLFKQSLDSLMLHYGFYAWSWTAAGKLLAKVGFGPEYEV